VVELEIHKDEARRIGRMNILRKMRIKYYNFLFRLIGVDAGPIMIRSMNSWLFIDDYGTIYLLKYTGQPGIPLEVTPIVKI
jgi:hypothetical protein